MAVSIPIMIGCADLPLVARDPEAFSRLVRDCWIGTSGKGAVLATEAAATRASRINVREALTYL